MRFLDEKKGLHPFQMQTGSRPHIFVFTVDMIPPEFHRGPSPCRHAMHLPAWEGLRADAVDYHNAFSVSPLCGPSRASLFTGRYPYIFVNEERAHDGTEVGLRPNDPIYPEYLKAAGYRLGHVGKSHVGTEAFIRAFGESCSPWNRWAPPVHDDPEYHAYLASQGIRGFRLRREIRGLKPDGVTPGNSYGGWIEQTDGTPFPCGRDLSPLSGPAGPGRARQPAPAGERPPLPASRPLRPPSALLHPGRFRGTRTAVAGHRAPAGRLHPLAGPTRHGVP